MMTTATHVHSDNISKTEQNDRRAAQLAPISGFSGFTDGRPQMQRQSNLQAMMQASPRSIQLAAVRAAIPALHSGAVAQLTAVTQDMGNAAGGLTSDKKIQTKNQGEAWFRFKKDDLVIESFSDNKTTQTPKGNSPVDRSVELTEDAVIGDEEIGNMTRAKHFGAGDRVGGITPAYRKGKWTWHHKQQPYEMELVDMAVHKSFGHHGGFSQWQEGAEDEQ